MSDQQWRRDGTLIGPSGCAECDVTNGSDWITVKGVSSKRSRELADQLVQLLNGGQRDSGQGGA